MSWDRVEYKETAHCACGKGSLSRTTYQEDDDWNRSRYGYFGETIECPYCSKKYHIEHLIRHFFQYKWDGDGCSDTTYLVENGFSINQKTEIEELKYCSLKETVVAKYTKEELMAAVEEMKTARFSTRLQLPVSKEIVGMYNKRYKKKSLPAIINFLQECLSEYDSFKWNPNTVNDYMAHERELAEEGLKKQKEALLHSVKVEWRR